MKNEFSSKRPGRPCSKPISSRAKLVSRKKISWREIGHLSIGSEMKERELVTGFLSVRYTAELCSRVNKQQLLYKEIEGDSLVKTEHRMDHNLHLVLFLEASSYTCSVPITILNNLISTIINQNHKALCK